MAAIGENSQRENDHLLKMLKELKSKLEKPGTKYEDQINIILRGWDFLAVEKSQGNGEETGSNNKSQLAIFLHDWTLKLVLQGDWPKLSNIIKTRLKASLQRCSLDSSVVQKSRILLPLVSDPWGHSTLKNIIEGVEISNDEMELYIFEETWPVVSARINILIKSRCEEMALRLLKVCMRSIEVTSDLRSISLSSEDDQNHFFDLYHVLLYKSNKSQFLDEIKNMNILKVIEHVKRLLKKPNTEKVWKNSHKIAELEVQIFLTSLIVKPFESAFETVFFEWCNVMKEVNKESEVLTQMIRKYIELALFSNHFYVMGSTLFKIFGEVHSALVTELLIRALTLDLNNIETVKFDDTQHDKKICLEHQMAQGFMELSTVFKQYNSLARECVLTSFSLHPTKESLERLTTFMLPDGAETYEIFKQSQKVENETVLRSAKDVLNLCSESIVNPGDCDREKNTQLEDEINQLNINESEPQIKNKEAKKTKDSTLDLLDTGQIAVPESSVEMESIEVHTPKRELSGTDFNVKNDLYEKAGDEESNKVSVSDTGGQMRKNTVGKDDTEREEKESENSVIKAVESGEGIVNEITEGATEGEVIESNKVNLIEDNEKMQSLIEETDLVEVKGECIEEISENINSETDVEKFAEVVENNETKIVEKVDSNKIAEKVKEIKIENEQADPKKLETDDIEKSADSTRKTNLPGSEDSLFYQYVEMLIGKLEKNFQNESKEVLDILSDPQAIFNATEIGLSKELCDDLAVVLSSPRWQILSWMLEKSKLLTICLKYLKDPQHAKNLTTELKYLDIDYSQFAHMPSEKFDEFSGIEKGYEQFVEQPSSGDERLYYNKMDYSSESDTESTPGYSYKKTQYRPSGGYTGGGGRGFSYYNRGKKVTPMLKNNYFNSDSDSGAQDVRVRTPANSLSDSDTDFDSVSSECDRTEKGFDGKRSTETAYERRKRLRMERPLHNMRSLRNYRHQSLNSRQQMPQNQSYMSRLGSPQSYMSRLGQSTQSPISRLGQSSQLSDLHKIMAERQLKNKSGNEIKPNVVLIRFNRDEYMQNKINREKAKDTRPIMSVRDKLDFKNWRFAGTIVVPKMETSNIKTEPNNYSKNDENSTKNHENFPKSHGDFPKNDDNAPGNSSNFNQQGAENNPSQSKYSSFYTNNGKMISINTSKCNPINSNKSSNVGPSFQNFLNKQGTEVFRKNNTNNTPLNYSLKKEIKTEDSLENAQKLVLSQLTSPDNLKDAIIPSSTPPPIIAMPVIHQSNVMIDKSITLDRLLPKATTLVRKSRSEVDAGPSELSNVRSGNSLRGGSGMRDINTGLNSAGNTVQISPVLNSVATFSTGNQNTVSITPNMKNAKNVLSCNSAVRVSLNTALGTGSQTPISRNTVSITTNKSQGTKCNESCSFLGVPNSESNQSKKVSFGVQKLPEVVNYEEEQDFPTNFSSSNLYSFASSSSVSDRFQSSTSDARAIPSNQLLQSMLPATRDTHLQSLSNNFDTDSPNFNTENPGSNDANSPNVSAENTGSIIQNFGSPASNSFLAYSQSNKSPLARSTVVGNVSRPNMLSPKLSSLLSAPVETLGPRLTQSQTVFGVQKSVPASTVVKSGENKTKAPSMLESLLRDPSNPNDSFTNSTKSKSPNTISDLSPNDTVLENDNFSSPNFQTSNISNNDITISQNKSKMEYSFTMPASTIVSSANFIQSSGGSLLSISYPNLVASSLCNPLGTNSIQTGANYPKVEILKKSVTPGPMVIGSGSQRSSALVDTRAVSNLTSVPVESQLTQRILSSQSNPVYFQSTVSGSQVSAGQILGSSNVVSLGSVSSLENSGVVGTVLNSDNSNSRTYSSSDFIQNSNEDILAVKSTGSGYLAVKSSASQLGSSNLSTSLTSTVTSAGINSGGMQQFLLPTQLIQVPGPNGVTGLGIVHPNGSLDLKLPPGTRIIKSSASSVRSTSSQSSIAPVSLTQSNSRVVTPILSQSNPRIVTPILTQQNSRIITPILNQQSPRQMNVHNVKLVQTNSNGQVVRTVVVPQSVAFPSLDSQQGAQIIAIQGAGQNLQKLTQIKNVIGQSVVPGGLVIRTLKTGTDENTKSSIIQHTSGINVPIDNKFIAPTQGDVLSTGKSASKTYAKMTLLSPTQNVGTQTQSTAVKSVGGQIVTAAVLNQLRPGTFIPTSRSSASSSSTLSPPNSLTLTPPNSVSSETLEQLREFESVFEKVSNKSIKETEDDKLTTQNFTSSRTSEESVIGTQLLSLASEANTTSGYVYSVPSSSEGMTLTLNASDGSRFAGARLREGTYITIPNSSQPGTLILVNPNMTIGGTVQASQPPLAASPALSNASSHSSLTSSPSSTPSKKSKAPKPKISMPSLGAKPPSPPPPKVPPKTPITKPAVDETDETRAKIQAILDQYKQDLANTPQPQPAPRNRKNCPAPKNDGKSPGKKKSSQGKKTDCSANPSPAGSGGSDSGQRPSTTPSPASVGIVHDEGEISGVETLQGQMPEKKEDTQMGEGVVLSNLSNVKMDGTSGVPTFPQSRIVQLIRHGNKVTAITTRQPYDKKSPSGAPPNVTIQGRINVSDLESHLASLLSGGSATINQSSALITKLIQAQQNSAQIVLQPTGLSGQNQSVIGQLSLQPVITTQPRSTQGVLTSPKSQGQVICISNPDIKNERNCPSKNQIPPRTLIGIVPNTSGIVPNISGVASNLSSIILSSAQNPSESSTNDLNSNAPFQDKSPDDGTNSTETLKSFSTIPAGPLPPFFTLTKTFMTQPETEGANGGLDEKDPARPDLQTSDSQSKTKALEQKREERALEQSNSEVPQNQAFQSSTATNLTVSLLTQSKSASQGARGPIHFKTNLNGAGLIIASSSAGSTFNLNRPISTVSTIQKIDVKVDQGSEEIPPSPATLTKQLQTAYSKDSALSPTVTQSHISRVFSSDSDLMLQPQIVIQDQSQFSRLLTTQNLELLRVSPTLSNASQSYSLVNSRRLGGGVGVASRQLENMGTVGMSSPSGDMYLESEVGLELDSFSLGDRHNQSPLLSDLAAPAAPLLSWSPRSTDSMIVNSPSINDALVTNMTLDVPTMTLDVPNSEDSLCDSSTGFPGLFGMDGDGVNASSITGEENLMTSSTSNLLTTTSINSVSTNKDLSISRKNPNHEQDHTISSTQCEDLRLRVMESTIRCPLTRESLDLSSESMFQDDSSSESEFDWKSDKYSNKFTENSTFVPEKPLRTIDHHGSRSGCSDYATPNISTKRKIDEMEIVEQEKVRETKEENSSKHPKMESKNEIYSKVERDYKRGITRSVKTEKSDKGPRQERYSNESFDSLDDRIFNEAADFTTDLIDRGSSPKQGTESPVSHCTTRKPRRGSRDSVSSRDSSPLSQSHYESPLGVRPRRASRNHSKKSQCQCCDPFKSSKKSGKMSLRGVSPGDFLRETSPRETHGHTNQQ